MLLAALVCDACSTESKDDSPCVAAVAHYYASGCVLPGATPSAPTLTVDQATAKCEQIADGNGSACNTDVTMWTNCMSETPPMTCPVSASECLDDENTAINTCQ